MVQDYNSVACIIERNEFYRKSYRSILTINLAILFLICLLLGFQYYQNDRFVKPRYFPTTPDGVVIYSPAENINHLLLNKLHFNDQGVLLEWPEINASMLDLQAEDSNEHAILVYWVTKAVLAMFDLDFVNYRSIMQEMRKYFSPRGYDRFLEALNDSNNLDTIKKGKRVAFATLTGKAKVTRTGILEGHKVWAVTVPVMVSYEASGQDTLTQELLAEVKVARVSTLQCPFFGLAIFQINFKVSS